MSYLLPPLVELDQLPRCEEIRDKGEEGRESKGGKRSERGGREEIRERGEGGRDKGRERGRKINQPRTIMVCCVPHTHTP